MFGKPVKVTKIDDLPFAQREKARKRREALYPGKYTEWDWTEPVKTETAATTKENAKTKRVKKGMGDSAEGIKTDVEKEDERQKKMGKK